MEALNWRQDDAEQFARTVKAHKAFPLIGGGAPTIEELEARNQEIRARFTELDTEYAGKRMSEDATNEWRGLKTELEENEVLVEELRGRMEFLRSVAGEEVERGEDTRSGGPFGTERGAHFNTPRSRGGDDNIWDVWRVRQQSSGPEDETRRLAENAKRAIDILNIPHVADEAPHKAELERKLKRFGEESRHEFSRRILTAGSPQYLRAFGKALAGAPMTADEQRALSVASNGGVAVPVTLDPTLISTSNGVVNPLRRIARNVQITGNTWRGVTATGGAASYDAEGVEVSDDSPTPGQPELNVEKAQYFVPFSIEIGQDWTEVQAELAMLMQERKDELEATKFLTGAGHGSNEPEGLLVGATGTTAGGSATYAVGNLFALEEALGPKYRPNAQFVASRFFYNKIRQLDTNGGAALWMQLERGLANNGGGNTGATVLGYPANELSTMSTSLNNGQKVAVFGDFRYFVIVDRIGTQVEIVPHLFGASGRPTGMRGFYAWWRNTSKVVNPNAFKTQVQSA